VLSKTCVWRRVALPIADQPDVVGKIRRRARGLARDIALRESEGDLAVRPSPTVGSPNKARRQRNVFGADDSAHPAVNYSAQHRVGTRLLGVPVTGIQQAGTLDSRRVPRHGRTELRTYFRKMGLAQCCGPSRPPTPCTVRTRKLTFRRCTRITGEPVDPPRCRPNQARHVDHFTRVTLLTRQ